MANAIDKADTTTLAGDVDADGLTAEELAFEDGTTFDDGDEVEDQADDTEDEAATESEDDTEAESEEEPESEDTTEDEQPEAEAEELTPEQKAEAERKQHNDEMAKLRIAERKAREEADAVRQAAEESNIKRYLEAAEHDEELLRERQAEVREYRHNEERIALNGEKLQIQIDRALANIDLFKTGTPKVQERMLKAIDTFEKTQTKRDERGRYVDISGDLYQYLEDEAKDIRELLGDGATKQIRQQTKTRAKAIPTPSRSPKKVKVDSDLAAFDEEANNDWS